MQAVLLAGGLGTRLRPYTETIPKPMIEVCGKPYLEYQIVYLLKYQITDIVLCTGYLGEMIEDYFGDGADWGLSIRYSMENEPMGTGGALKLALPMLEDNFFLIYGDSFLPVDYADLESCFRDSGKDLIITVYDNSDETTVKNNIALDDAGYVAVYEKNSDNPDMKYVDAGVLALDKNVVSCFPKQEKFSLETDVFPELIRKKQCRGYVTKKRFYDIGTVERLRVFEQYLNEEGLPC